MKITVPERKGVMTEHKLVRTNFLWSYTQKFGLTVISLLTAGVLSRLLLPEHFGAVAISISINAIAGVFLNFGFVSAIVQEKEHTPEQLASAFYFNMAIAVVLMLALMAAAGPLANYYKIKDLQNVIIVSSISFIFYAASIVPTALLTKTMRYKTIAIRSIIAATLSGGVGVWMAYNGYGVWSIVIQQLLYVIFNTIGSYLAVGWLPSLYYKFQSIRHMFRFGIFMFLSGVLDSIYSRMDVFVIGKVFALKTLGQYSRAQSFDTQLRDLTSSSIIGVLFPIFALKRDKVDELRATYINYFEMVTLIFCVFSGGLFLSANFVINLLFGNQWNESIGYFKLLIIAGFAYPLSSLSLSIIEARGNSKNFFRVEVIKKILFLPTYYIAYKFGIINYLISYIIACFIGTFINVLFAQFEIEFDFKKIFFTFFKYYLPAAAIVLFLYYLTNNYTFFNYQIDGVIAAIIFVISFLAIQISTKSNGFVNLKAFISK